MPYPEPFKFCFPLFHNIMQFSGSNIILFFLTERKVHSPLGCRPGRQQTDDDYHGKGQHEILPFQYAGIFTHDHALSHTQQTEGFMRPVNKEGDRRSNQDTAKSVKTTHLKYDLADIFFPGTNRFENTEMIAFFYDNHPDASHQIERNEDNSRSEEHTSELQSREKLVCRLLL